jgi:predicted small secreted protein
MPGLIKTWGIALPLALLCSLAAAAPTEPAPARSEPTVVDRVGNSVKHGVERAASATERGVKKAAHAVGRAASATAHGVGRAASATGNAVERTARKIGLPTAASSSASSPQ